MKKMFFSYNFPKHDCFQQDEMRKKQIKIVPSLFAEAQEPIFIEVKRFLLMLGKCKFELWKLSHGTLGTLDENILKMLLERKLWD